MLFRVSRQTSQNFFFFPTQFISTIALLFDAKIKGKVNQYIVYLKVNMCDVLYKSV